MSRNCLPTTPGSEIRIDEMTGLVFSSGDRFQEITAVNGGQRPSVVERIECRTILPVTAAVTRSHARYFRLASRHFLPQEGRPARLS
jgi:hypothetical protein